MHIQNPSVLHIIQLDKFIAPFIDFVEEHFQDFDRHLFACQGDLVKFPVRRRDNIFFKSDFNRDRWFYLQLHRKMYGADKIIIHGLWNPWVVRFLALQPWLLRKCYWVIWGGDLYAYKFALPSLYWRRLERFRRIVIRRIAHLVTYVEGDVKLARKWYGATGKYHECLMYPSNLYNDIALPSKELKTINIQIGNSADPTNEHFEMLDILAPYKDRDIKIFAPLSYGPIDHADKVVTAGRDIFGEKFVALTEFMSSDQYIDYLSTIDIAIFNHRRQQGMGNIISLLGMGKKVYLRKDVTSWSVFEKQGVKLYDISCLEMDRIEDFVATENRKLIQANFSSLKLKEGLKQIFG